MNIAHTNSFAVFPQDCNYHYPMVFGGKMLAEMDRCAATTVRRLLYDSPTGAKNALTVGVNNVTFHKGAEVGDLIFLTGTVIKVGTKAITVRVVAERERLVSPRIKEETFIPVEQHKYNGCTYFCREEDAVVGLEKMAEGEFTFCSYDMNAKQSMPHGILQKEVDEWLLK